jgi:hypothetical protein
MTDRELVKFAAIAAGMWDYANDCIDVPWSPLSDDGDAFRLAVKLHIHIEWVGPPGIVNRVQASPKGYGHLAWVQLLEDDPYAATRRAIVRAAAELGKAKA